MNNVLKNTLVETDPRIAEELKKRLNEGWSVLSTEHTGTELNVTVRMPDGNQTVISFKDEMEDRRAENKFVPPGESNSVSAPLPQNAAIFALNLNRT